MLLEHRNQPVACSSSPYASVVACSIISVRRAVFSRGVFFGLLAIALVPGPMTHSYHREPSPLGPRPTAPQ
jgi:hypothetical protein